MLFGQGRKSAGRKPGGFVKTKQAREGHVLRTQIHLVGIITTLFMLTFWAQGGFAQSNYVSANQEANVQDRMNELARKYTQSNAGNNAVIEPVAPLAPAQPYCDPIVSTDSLRHQAHSSDAQPAGETVELISDPIEQTPIGTIGGENAMRMVAQDWNTSGWNLGLSTLSALGLVILLILFVRWLWGRLSGQVTTRRNQVVEVLCRTAIAPRNHILLLRVGCRIIVIADGSQGMRTLAELTDPEEIAHVMATVSTASPNSISRNFSGLISRFSHDYERDTFQEEGADESEHTFDSARNSISNLLSRVRTMAGGGGMA